MKSKNKVNKIIRVDKTVYIKEEGPDSLVVLKKHKKYDGNFLNLKGYLLQYTDKDFSPKGLAAFVAADGSFLIDFVYKGDHLERFSEADDEEDRMVGFSTYEKNPQEYDFFRLPEKWIGTQKMIEYTRNKERAKKSQTKSLVKSKQL